MLFKSKIIDEGSCIVPWRTQLEVGRKHAQTKKWQEQQRKGENNEKWKNKRSVEMV